MIGFDFIYPARIKPDAGGGYLVTFRDLPEALTDGTPLAEARASAADALAEDLASRIKSRKVGHPNGTISFAELSCIVSPKVSP